MSYINNDNYAVCPHCQTEFTEDDMMNAEVGMWEEQNEEIVACPECGKKFFINIEARFIYLTDTENDCGETPEEIEREEKERAEQYKRRYEQFELNSKLGKENL